MHIRTSLTIFKLRNLVPLAVKRREIDDIIMIVFGDVDK